MPEKNNNSATKKVSKILLIEENFFMAQLLADRLKNRSFEVVKANDEGEAKTELNNGPFALVVVDNPQNGGPSAFGALLDNVHKVLPNTPILFLLDKSSEKYEKLVKEHGATEVLAKEDVGVVEIIDTALRMVSGKIQSKPVVKKKEAKNTPTKIVEKKNDVLKKSQNTLNATNSDPNLAENLKKKIETISQGKEEDVSIISLVDNLMGYAYLMRASDIHIEPFEKKIIVRLRVDGILSDTFSFPKTIQPGIISRIKVLGAMRTDEHQAAQDGRFRISLKNSEIKFDVRVSIVPTFFGENAVLRLLAEQTQLNSLDDLDLSDSDRKKVRKAVGTPYGMILATGPTGSGKTTTLYTILKELSTREVQIITIEDPVEYSIEGVDQIQVNNRTELTFANGLRSILRQDPDIVLVGEIRDEETASVAVNGALTGHKLLSTLHTNDAATTLPRLLDMGVEPFLIASTINIALGQRLLRMICEKCKIPKKITGGEFSALQEIISPEILDDNHDFFEGKGCPKCSGKGYKGRMGIYEILEMNDFIREAIMRNADAGEIKKIAIKNGMTTLLEDGFKKALSGLTTIEELLRVIHD